MLIYFDNDKLLNVSLGPGDGITKVINAKLKMLPLRKTLKNIDYSIKQNDNNQLVPRAYDLPHESESNYYVFSQESDVVCFCIQ